MSNLDFCCLKNSNNKGAAFLDEKTITGVNDIKWSSLINAKNKSDEWLETMAR